MNVSNNTTSSKENLALRTKASNEQHLSSSSSSEEEQRLLPLLDTLDSDSAYKSNMGSRDDDVQALMEYMKQSKPAELPVLHGTTIFQHRLRIFLS
ncbi:hypothetical protein L5515_019561 [Caenorhabditis briggsae]|uniref:Uncharacterized protein n=1 Tax=Caenorhabditis briggsae TaxID=6238 RepID=A0AAE9JTZ8_CAEBR|nr:hypothetical protein L5515_019561 [Caenorhabditis briggsae]